MRKIEKVFSDSKVKNKKIVYRNKENNFVSSYYYKPFDLEVTGC